MSMDDYRTGYMDGEANRDLEVNWLKQQLATRDALYQEAHDALDNATKQNVLLRELLIPVSEDKHRRIWQRLNQES